MSSNTTYTDVFTGNPVSSSPTGYQSYSLASNTIFSWPITNEDTSFVAADIIEINATASSLTFNMPAANQVGNGKSCIIKNTGSNTFTMADFNGTTIVSIASGQIFWLYVRDNSTVQGTWGQFQYGATTSTANAASLASANIIAIGTQLDVAFPVSSLSTGTTLTASQRSTVAEWTGGAGAFNLTASGTLGNNWFALIKNAGSGTLTISPNVGDLIDGNASFTLSPNQATFLVCTGTGFISVGFGQASTNSFTRLVVNVAGGVDVTLTSAQAAYTIIEFTGLMTASFNIIAPTSVGIFWFYNNTTGAFTLTIKTAAGTGIAVTQGNRTILHCDGTNVVNSINSTSGTVTSVATGTGLTGGPITSTGTVSIASTAVVASSYGGSNTLVSFTVNAQGQLTAAATGSTALIASNNLSDVSNATTSLTNLGGLKASNNLSDVSNAATSRTNLGLGTAATQSTGTFLQVANNLADLASLSTALSNLGFIFGGGSSGYVRLPGGFYFQWGTAVPTVGAGVNVAMPVTFPNNFWNFTCSFNSFSGNTANGSTDCIFGQINSTSQANIKRSGTDTITGAFWIAIGN